MPEHEDQTFDSLPPAIVDALRESDGPAALPDPARDADVLSGARRHLAGQDRKRRNLRLFFAGGIGGAVAAAAVLGLALLIGAPTGNEESADMALSGPPNEGSERVGHYEPDAEAVDESMPTMPGDINQSGGVDILDAYALARQIERGESDPAYDLNRDGQVGQPDIDWIANRAVALNRGEQG